MIEALPCECHISFPWELLHADDLVIKSDNLEDLKIQLQAWRRSLDTWGIRINVGKTKVLGSSGEAQSQQQLLNGPVVCVSKEFA